MKTVGGCLEGEREKWGRLGEVCKTVITVSEAKITS